VLVFTSALHTGQGKPNGGPDLGPSIHLLLPDDLLDQFGCLFGCGGEEEEGELELGAGADADISGGGGVLVGDGGDIQWGGGAIQVDGLDIVSGDDITLPSFPSSCNQAGCNGHGLAAIPHPDSKPIVVLLGMDDDNQTGVVVLGDEEEKEILGETGLMATLLNSLFSQDPTSVLSFDPSEITAARKNIEETREEKENKEEKGEKEEKEGKEEKGGKEENDKEKEDQDESGGVENEIYDNNDDTDAEDGEEDDLPSYNRVPDQTRDPDQISVYNPSEDTGDNSVDRAPRKQSRSGRRRQNGKDVVSDAREIEKEKKVVAEREEEARSSGFQKSPAARQPSWNTRSGRTRGGRNFAPPEAHCAANMACVQLEDCGSDGYIKGSRKGRRFHVGGRGMLQRCSIKGVAGFCCRTE